MMRCCECPPNSLQVHRKSCKYYARPCMKEPVDQMQVIRICMTDNITCRGAFAVRQCHNCGSKYRCGDGRWVRCPTREGLLREIRELESLTGLEHYDYRSEAIRTVEKDIVDIKAGLKATSCAMHYCSTDCYYSALCWQDPVYQ